MYEQIYRLQLVNRQIILSEPGKLIEDIIKSTKLDNSQDIKKNLNNVDLNMRIFSIS